jgi:hypothetical protein
VKKRRNASDLFNLVGNIKQMQAYFIKRASYPSDRVITLNRREEKMKSILISLIALFCFAGAALTVCCSPEKISFKAQDNFQWPQGKRAAISLSFDDASYGQVDYGIPILDKYGIKATFYVRPKFVGPRLAGWQKAVANGHEIGNHTRTHPCSGNNESSRNNPLESYTQEKPFKAMYLW